MNCLQTYLTEEKMENKKHKVKFVPIVKECTYYHKNKEGVCRNCNDTRKFIAGYHLIVEDKDGNKIGFQVDTLK